MTEFVKQIYRQIICIYYVAESYVEAKESFADDKKISKWAKTAVYTCQMADIVNGKGAGTFDPQGPGTRAEASVIFTKFHKDYLK